MKKFAERLKDLREERELSMSAVARSLQIGHANFVRWERAEQEITSGNLIKLADFFDVTIDYLVGRTDDY